MANHLAILLILTTSISMAIAQKIEIDSRIVFNGRKVASPRILAYSGERSKIVMNDQKQHREYSLEILPVLLDNKGIGLHYSLAIQDHENETFSRGFIEIPHQERGLISIDKGKIKIHLKIKDS